ncbi:MAG: phenylalanine--tRNA ligase subunit alpha [Thermoproteota archaeon]|nr:phenylalanine--tRNA ligase subunit alpha [Thermoproteota archaeon]
MSSAPQAFHPIERSILNSLSNNDHVGAHSLAASTGLSIDQIRRGIEWLKFKNLISIEESSTQRVFVASEGIEAAKKGLPERRLVNSLKEGKVTISQVLASGAIKNEEINAAIAGARRNQWIQLVEGKMVPTPLAAKKSPEETFIENLKRGGGGVEISKLTEEEKPVLELLKKRPNYIEIKEEKESRISLTDAAKQKIIPTLNQEKKLEHRRLTTELITSGKWKETNFSALDVQAPAPVIYPGRRHPLIEIIEEIKEIFIGLGFSEIEGPIIQSSFWNFDALFTPQDHPSREMQDTFYIAAEMRQPPLPASKDQISKISQTHRERWNRHWDVEESQRLVLRTHTTPVTVQHLAKVKSSDVGRFYSVGRVFRNEKVSYKHLVEFHQVEGVSTSEEASLRDLMGLQKEFYAKMGLKRIKFWPTFFPYTEPSLQSMVYNEKLEKWVELFGMGIFRPEVTKPLGIKNPVLAWGGGLERIAMLRFGLDDVRELYGNKLAWLRSVPKCQL